ncbi:response regulator [Pseudoruegeria sp. SHC-113]|uniref:hybrid sensor histidine kinase/response regulator n=1 Tax=Pseudoruegeria sp. SHC-113 TaxID=2855439 RepID=UPI0021BACFB8|nr:response regulator [Pseudoruegeria sp. SHC-113]MCT8161765.1 response regulator [Pseudoruegeria sp. SHC-113]
MNRPALLIVLSAIALVGALFISVWQTERMAGRTLAALAEHRAKAWVEHTSEQLLAAAEGAQEDQSGHAHGGHGHEGHSHSHASTGAPDGLALLITEGAFPDHLQAILGAELAADDVFRFKLFDANGTLVFLSDTIGSPEPAADLGSHSPTAAAAIAAGRAHTSIGDGRDRADRPDHYAETYVPLFLNGQPAGTAEIYTDISASHPRAAAAFHRLSAIIAAVMIAAFLIPLGAIALSQRHLKVTNVALAKARDEALAAEHAKGRFLANMSHEIRTPMNGVMGMTELLRETELDEDQRSCADTIYASSAALLEIINDVLDYSKVEAGQMTVDCSPFDLRALVQDVAALLFPVANAKGVEICVSLDFDAPVWMLGDAPRIRQCLLNIAGNAVKFTDSGHVLITASPTDCGTVALIVEDTGAGIPEDKIEHVFAAFEQVDNNATRRFDGTGLGLAITRRLAQLMGGEVTARSTFGIGSTFTLNLPLERCDAPDLSSCPEMAGLEGRKVLVVDDLETNRRILDVRLSRWGMDVTLADGAPAALALLDAGAVPDIFVLDYCMPDVSGEDLYKEIRKRPALAAVPAIILSSGETSAIRARLLEEGLEEILPKPARTEQLARVLSRALGQAHPLAVQPELQPGLQTPPEGFPGLHILLAEDNRTNQLVTRKMLEPLGIEITLAQNGREAVESYKAFPPDLVLMDVSMPVMGGLEATRLLRTFEAHGKRPRCPIIALTANAMAEDRALCSEAGMDDHLAKPLTKQALIDCVARWSKDYRLRRESA